MKNVRSKDGNRISIVSERYRDGVDKDWHQNSSAGALEYKSNKLVRKGRIVLEAAKDFASWIHVKREPE